MIVLGVHSELHTECTRIFEIAIAVFVLRRILTPEKQPGAYNNRGSIYSSVCGNFQQINRNDNKNVHLV